MLGKTVYINLGLLLIALCAGEAASAQGIHRRQARTDPGAPIRAQRTCPAPLAPAAAPDASVAALAPNLGAPAGLSDPVCQANPNGDHPSAVRPEVRVPCDCPPSQEDFNAQFAVDHGSDVPTGDAEADRTRRIELATITLQNSFCCPNAAVAFN